MGIFDDKVDLWAYRKVRVQFRSELLGGVPRDPKTLRNWLLAAAGATSEEVMAVRLKETLEAVGQEIEPDLSFAGLLEAVTHMEGQRINGFKRVPEQAEQAAAQLYIEGRQIKAMIKEQINILYAMDRWGPTGKGTKAYAAERVFVMEDVIPLNRIDPDGVIEKFVHVNTPQGRRSSIERSEWVWRPTIEFHVMIEKVRKQSADEKAPRGFRPGGRTELCIPENVWHEIWVSGQENGIGASRSQGFGRFDIIGWDEADRKDVPALGRDAFVTVDAVYAGGTLDQLEEQEADEIKLHDLVGAAPSVKNGVTAG